MELLPHFYPVTHEKSVKWDLLKSNVTIDAHPRPPFVRCELIAVRGEQGEREGWEWAWSERARSNSCLRSLRFTVRLSWPYISEVGQGCCPPGFCRWGNKAQVAKGEAVASYWRLYLSPVPYPSAWLNQRLLFPEESPFHILICQEQGTMFQHSQCLEYVQFQFCLMEDESKCWYFHWNFFLFT